MPRSRRGCEKIKSIRPQALQDFTITDFANANIKSGTGRLKKSLKVGGAQEVKELDEKSWYDKDLCEFDDILLSQDNNATEADGESKDESPRCARERTRRRRHVGTRVEGFSGSATYPLDLWYVLSQYVHAEDVGHFAAICKDAYHITCTISFWICLYKRYYRPDVTLPVLLRPACLEQRYSLKTRVIRALFYLHDPLVRRTKQLTAPFETPPHFLQGSRCMLMWHQRVKANNWTFLFKFRRAGTRLAKTVAATEGDALDYLDNYRANSEDGCSVLSVTCCNFISLPIVMGQMLTQVCVNVSRNMRFHRVKLVFHSLYNDGRQSATTGCVAILDPVVSIRVSHWWHPQYPMCNATIYG
ncbi:PREDICTED: transmembrane protein 183-like [Priapulus caudatus]|uniref:Transmembrane protein 183-like n=1 Tax=Priapulus caudatus TaxID=37621 RepID=A0ABM1EU80_PRICU|nr:PREDICTED: transmembrane protein 183-like [Priapulus caudatus]